MRGQVVGIDVSPLADAEPPTERRGLTPPGMVLVRNVVSAVVPIWSVEMMRGKLLVLLAFTIFTTAQADMNGWDEMRLETMTAGCVAGIVEVVKRDFKARVSEKGHPDAVFPEVQLKPSVVKMCSCITRTASENWAFDEFTQNPSPGQRLVTEVMSGGRCRPTGTLGKMMEFIE